MLNKNASLQSAAWDELTKQKSRWDRVHLRDFFTNNPARFDDFHARNDGLLFDYSKNLIDADTITALNKLAKACDLSGFIKNMREGKPLNHTENRAVLHTALRGSIADDVNVDGENVNDFVAGLQAQIKTISEDLRSNNTITDVIHIGVGGSDLGPHLVCDALKPLQGRIKLHFLKNIDGQSIQECLKTLSPENTAVLIASKSFTTLESSYNADLVKSWMQKKLNAQQCSDRMFAMTACPDKAENFGIKPDHILPMRDWVGGRFSLWSSIGLPIAIALGYDVFEQLLKGAHSADTHFFTTPFEQNIPVLMGMLSVWYRNIWDFHGHAILPYADSLEILPTYMQQLEMESNGKFHDSLRTSPIVFGGAGTCSQHAFMQALHQSREITPCDFIIAANNPYAPQEFQNALNANALAQSQALMLGQTAPKGEDHRHFSGGRPSTVFVLPQLTPYYLGMLLAFYEHKIVVEGCIWGINSFDQWGVELGKTLANDIIRDMAQQKPCDTHDSSTKNLIHEIITAEKSE